MLLWIGYSLRNSEYRVLITVIGVALAIRFVFPRLPARVKAYGLNWILPAVTAFVCVRQGLRKDYWGVAFWSIGFGFALVNAVFLYPSPRRTMLFRTLIRLLVLVSAAAIWEFIWP
jgi:hypothetical protein